MIDISRLSKFYLFADSENCIIIRKLKKLKKNFNYDIICDTDIRFSCIFYKEKFIAGNNKYYHKIVINDINDYKLEDICIRKGPDLNDRFETLLSFALMRNNSFIAATDYLALFNHFYYRVKNTFLCSNNLFIIAKLIDAELSVEAIYETLFFRFPRKERTYFAEIKCLNKFQKLIYNKSTGFELQKEASYKDLIFNSPGNISEDVKSYMNSIELDPNSNTFLSFSGGSDSMCALAILRGEGIKYKLISYPGHDEWDTARIIKLSKKLKNALIFINPEQNEQDELFYSYLTNGFSPSSSFLSFYKAIPAKSNIFDGYNTLFGDWSDAFIYPPLKDSLKGIKRDELINKFYRGLKPVFLRNMIDYIFESCPDVFIDANTHKGIEFAQNHSVEFIPSRILSGVLYCSENFLHKNFSFQLTRRFLSFLFYNKYGINKTFSARNDYPGALIKSPLSIIVKDLDPLIFKLPMDHGISFMDMYKKSQLINFKMNLQRLKRKIYYLRRKRIVRMNNNLSKDFINDFDFAIRNEDLNSYLMQSLSAINNVKKVIENIVI